MNIIDSEVKVEFSIGEPPIIVPTTFDTELMIGRSDAPTHDYPGLDLTPFNAGELGISRQHAVIRSDGTHLTLQDLNSGNGTVLNGIRLKADTPYQLADGDVIYFGHLLVTVHFQKKTEKSAIRAARVELNLRTAPLAGQGQRVLILEDDVTLLHMYQTALEKANYTVQTCRDVVSAIRALNHTTPAVIMLDLMLAGVHGLELCRYVRRDANYPTIPIAVVSALNDNAAIQQAMDAGADVFLNKPLHMRELIRVVGALINKNEADNPAHHTKKLAGTASLDHIEASSRKDTLIIFVEGHREPIGIVVPTQVTLGRKYPSNSGAPHIDLDKSGAFDKGVSRLHAVIKRRDNGFVAEDMGSSNGTYVNGRSLIPPEAVPLHNGDELRLGELRMHIYMLAETGQVS